MSQWYKSSFVKAMWVMVAHLCAAMMAVSCVWLLAYPVFLNDLFTGGSVKQFNESKGFVEQLSLDSREVLSGILASQQVETEEEYDPDRIVDIQTYIETGNISNENQSGLAYRLGDLYQWGESSASSRSGDDQIIVCKRVDQTYRYYSYIELELLMHSGELKFVMASDEGMTSKGMLSMLKEGSVYEGFVEQNDFKGIQDKEGKMEYIDCWNYDGYAIEEKYAPVGAEHITDIVNKDSRWNGKLNQVNEDVDAAISMVAAKMGSYRMWKENLQEGDTNLAYIYADTASKKIYTNREEYQEYEKLDASVNTIASNGKYVMIKPKLSEFQTNVKGAEAEEWRSYVKTHAGKDKDFVYIVGVDTQYPVQDIYYQQNNIYKTYGSNVQLIALIGIVAVVTLLISIIWLTIVAGRNTKDDLLHLNAFDQWKTELAAAVIVIVWFIPVIPITAGVGIGSTQQILYEGVVAARLTVSSIASILPATILGVAIAVWTCAFFLMGYLSFVRRIKGKRLWENSILGGGLQFLILFFINLNLIWKLVLLFAGFVFIHWVAADTYRKTPFLGLMFLTEIAAFVYLVRVAIGRQRLREGIEHIAAGEVDYKIPLHGLKGEQLMLAERVNAIGEGLDTALEESMKSERLKTDLITNVSHDIKTPLTSIINYIGLLKNEQLEDPRIQRYIEVLEEKAQRLKTLTEDVVEASKVSSGNITLEYMNINLVEMIQQTSGEFEEKLKARNLTEVLLLPEAELTIKADGKRVWRIIENVYNNAAKYAMEGTRIYAELSGTDKTVVFNLKNVSQYALNIRADELTERFIRGDVSRSSEGSGLGLSIAKSLTTMQGGTFDIYVDGDLFKVTITFPRV